MNFTGIAAVITARLFQCLPLPVSSAIGAGLGHLYAWQADLRGQRWIERTRRNLTAITRDHDKGRINRRLYGLLRSSGRVTAEIPSLSACEAYTTYHGLEHLSSLDGPAVLLFAHLSNWDFACLPFLRTDRPVFIIYDPPENETVHRILVDARLKLLRTGAPGSKLLVASPGVTRELVRAAQRRDHLLIAVDEFKSGLVWGPPLGRQLPYAGNRMLAARIARKFDYKLLPVSVNRSGGVNFDLTIHPPIESSETDDVEADIRATADAISDRFEALVVANVDQWYWLPELNLERPFPK